MKKLNLPELNQIKKWQAEAKKQNKTLVLLVAGDSAAGKSVRTSTFGFKKIITTTTRPIRDGETNGVDYDFITEKQFNTLKNNGMFLETTVYGWHSYGTKKLQFENQLASKQPCYIILDMPGIINMKSILEQKYPNDFLVKSIYYYIDEKTFLKRIKARDKNYPKEYVQKRLEENNLAHAQLKNKSVIDYSIDASKEIKELKHK